MKYLGYSELTQRLYILPMSKKQPKIDITEDVLEYINFRNGKREEDLEDEALIAYPIPINIEHPYYNSFVQEAESNRQAYIAGRKAGLEMERAKDERVRELEEALKDLIFTAEKLWNDTKPLQDTEIMKVTHPTIEQAKQLLKK